MMQGCKRSAKRAPARMSAVQQYLAVAVLAVMTAACATLTPDSPTEEKVKVVTERATALWNAIIGKDFDAAYGYMSPATRATVTPAGFKTIASRIAYREAKVTGATCDAGTCRVKLLITYDAPAPIPTGIQRKDATMMRGIHTPLEENWVIEQGQVLYVWPL